MPSLAEAPTPGYASHVFYTIDTVRRFRREHPDDHLYFIVGADQFLEIPTWKNYEVAARRLRFHHRQPPGISPGRVAAGDPAGKVRPRVGARTRTRSCCAKSEIHLLTTVASHVSSTEVRERLERKQSIHGLVPARVEEYILGQALYR